MATSGIFKILGWMTTKEAAATIGLHRNTIWNAIKQGQIPSRKIGHTIALDPKDVAAFCARYLNGEMVTATPVTAVTTDQGLDMATPGIFKALGLMTTKEAAAAVGVTPATIWNAIQQNHIPSKKIGNAIALEPKDVTSFRKKYLRGMVTSTSPTPKKKGRPIGSTKKVKEADGEVAAAPKKRRSKKVKTVEGEVAAPKKRRSKKAEATGVEV